MLSIVTKNNEIELQFDGIKIFQCDNTTKLYKDLFINSFITIDNKKIKEEDIIYINELTKNSDFINLNKKSFLLNEVNKNISEFEIINYKNIELIKDKINKELDFEFLDSSEGDLNKIIMSLLECTNGDFLNHKTFDILLEKIFNDKKLIIIDNISWLYIKDIYKYINKHNILILTNDFRKVIKDNNELEILVIFNQNNFIEIQDTNVLINYLEVEMNKIIEEDKFFHNLLDINDQKSIIYFEKIKKIF